MPSPDHILAGLAAIANEAIALAIAWHVVVVAVLVALAAGWRPSQRTARVSLALPLASAAVVAGAFGNPFNAGLLGVGAVALGVLGWFGPQEPVRRGSSWTLWAGVACLSLGSVYPHFLDAHPAMYLFAAPLGLVPCPTLLASIGAALAGGALGVRAYSLTLAGLGLFYGLFGVLRLGVLLDVGLVLGSLALGAAAFRAGDVPQSVSTTRA